MAAYDGSDTARELERRKALAEALSPDAFIVQATTFNPITFALAVTGALGALGRMLFALASRRRRKRSPASGIDASRV
jgi:hypothetical protein